MTHRTAPTVDQMVASALARNSQQNTVKHIEKAKLIRRELDE